MVLLCGLAPSSAQNATEQRAAASLGVEPRTNLDDAEELAAGRPEPQPQHLCTAGSCGARQFCGRDEYDSRANECQSCSDIGDFDASDDFSVRGCALALEVADCIEQCVPDNSVGAGDSEREWAFCVEHPGKCSVFGVLVSYVCACCVLFCESLDLILFVCTCGGGGTCAVWECFKACPECCRVWEVCCSCCVKAFTHRKAEKALRENSGGIGTMPTNDMDRGSSKDANVHVVENKAVQENKADELARADRAIPEGTRICVTGCGRGAYVSFGKKTFGANEHTIAFDSGDTAVIQLTGLKEVEWTVKEAEMDELDPPLQVTVQTLEQRKIPLQLSSYTRVESVKAMIEEKAGIPAANQRLLLNKLPMEDDSTLEQSEVEDGATISLVLRLPVAVVGAEPGHETALVANPMAGGAGEGQEWDYSLVDV